MSASMKNVEFWCVEVKPNEPVLVNVGRLKLLHISHAALGEVDAGNHVENITLKVGIGRKQMVLGTLSSDTAPHTALNLSLEIDMELSHSWEHGSVFFFGYLVDVSGYLGKDQKKKLMKKLDKKEKEVDQGLADQEVNGPFPLKGIPMPRDFLAPDEPRKLKPPKAPKVAILRWRQEE